MNNHAIITHAELDRLALDAARVLLAKSQSIGGPVHVYPIPRGGVSAFLAIKAAFARLPVVTQYPDKFALIVVPEPEQADAFVDDLIDSGKTMDTMLARNSVATPVVLIDKRTGDDRWVVFPWEATLAGSSDDIFTRLLQFVGEDPDRPGLKETPARMAKAWKEWTQGYGVEPASIIKMFEDGAEVYDEMVHTSMIPFYSNCEHHLAPFFGTVSFAYIPDKKIVGLSKMPRLVEVFARRLQVQERLTAQVIDAFVENVKPKGAGITIRARHLCMESRGINRIGCETVTNRFFGVLKDDHKARMEYLTLTGNGRSGFTIAG